MEDEETERQRQLAAERHAQEMEQARQEKLLEKQRRREAREREMERALKAEEHRQQTERILADQVRDLFLAFCGIALLLRPLLVLCVCVIVLCLLFLTLTLCCRRRVLRSGSGRWRNRMHADGPPSRKRTRCDSARPTLFVSISAPLSVCCV